MEAKEDGDPAHLSVQGGVQQHVVGLQVQMEYGGREVVQEVYAQGDVVNQSEGQRPRRGSF